MLLFKSFTLFILPEENAGVMELRTSFHSLSFKTNTILLNIGIGEPPTPYNLFGTLKYWNMSGKIASSICRMVGEMIEIFDENPFDDFRIRNNHGRFIAFKYANNFAVLVDSFYIFLPHGLHVVSLISYALFSVIGSHHLNTMFQTPHIFPMKGSGFGPGIPFSLNKW